jgi:hypothetical protein
MNRHPRAMESPVLLARVWKELPIDLQQSAVRLLAQLAYAQSRQPIPPSSEEIPDVSQQRQDPSRPS